jgi:glycosyltransferase involved in cell wall biosynthesis
MNKKINEIEIEKGNVSSIAYLTGMYPKVSHTFILREVEALRKMGAVVLPCSIRRPSPDERRGVDLEAEYTQTFYLLESARNPLRLLGAHFKILVKSPRRWLLGAKLAWQTCPPGMKAIIWQIFYLAEAGVLASYLEKRCVGHLHNHLGDASGTVALLAAKMAGIPFSYTAHGPDLFFAPTYWRIDVKTAQACFVACISHFCKSQMMLFSKPEDWDKFVIVRCGINPERYGNMMRSAFSHHILFVGRLADVKGVPLLLEAFVRIRARYPKAKLTLVGDGPERSSLQARAMALGLDNAVEFLGYCTQQEVAEQMNMADFLVLPSFAEGLPVVLMEALASGIPVIATSVAGVSELVHDGKTGLLVPSGDIEGLEEALDRLLGDPDLCWKLGKAGRLVVRELHDVEREAGKLLSLFRNGGPEAGHTTKP